jgi:PPP family 3-phenylpropionic acid transporter
MNTYEQADCKKYLLGFFGLYAVTYMCNAIYNTFIPLYLDNAGFSSTAMGILLSIGPLMAILAQPVWGLASDRAGTKNNVLKVLLLGSAVSILLYGVSTGFIYLFFTISLFTLFQTSINPISDAITLESIEKSSIKFGPIRLAGTVGYALMAVAAGVMTKYSLNIIFPLYSLFAVLGFAIVYLLPKVQGHQKKNSKMSPLALFKNKKLVVLMLFNLIFQITLSYYYSFFAIHYRNLGADNVLLGWSQLVSALSELPFLLVADRIIKKFGTERVLTISAAVAGIRWMLLYLVTDVHAIIFVNMLHGANFIVFQFSMATYINKNVPKELRATGQTINGLLGLGLARIIGSVRWCSQRPDKHQANLPV